MEGKSYEEQVAEAKTRVREVAPGEASALRSAGDAVFVDVREPNEWNLFRIPGAVHLPLGDVRSRARDAVAPGRRVVVYCARGNRSALAADAMSELGYTDVVSLAGGIMAWMSAGGEVEE
ncbi:MAG TPA: rhodanese-like domain-containing protein [Gemmatimonadaceae bacterium]